METCKNVLAIYYLSPPPPPNLRTVHWICMTFDILEFHKNFQLIAVLVKLRQQGQILLHEDIFEIVCAAQV
jgi:hypothetical protein